MRTVAIVNRKGGVGKTTTAQAFGAGLIRRGYTVLYIDLDSQCNLSYGMNADSRQPSIMDVLTGHTTAAEAIQRTERGDIIAGSEALAGADALIDGTGKEYRLREALEGIEHEYDFAIIDTPAALGALTVNALTAAQDAIIPVIADIYSIQGIKQLYEAIQAVKKYCNRELTISGILITRYNSRTRLSKDMRESLEDVASQIGTKVFKTPIRECIAVKEFQALQMDIFAYAPRSNAAKDYDAVIEEYLQG